MVLCTMPMNVTRTMNSEARLVQGNPPPWLMVPLPFAAPTRAQFHIGRLRQCDSEITTNSQGFSQRGALTSSIAAKSASKRWNCFSVSTLPRLEVAMIGPRLSDNFPGIKIAHFLWLRILNFLCRKFSLHHS